MTAMWLVLGDPADRAAAWAYEGLRQRGLRPLQLLTPDALIRSARQEHRVGADGTSFHIRLADGRPLASSDIRGVLNRIVRAPVHPPVLATRADSDYAAEELNALMLSWLLCVAPVTVNRPSPAGFCGAWRTSAQWAVLAARAGLPVPVTTLSSRTGTAPRELPATHSVVVLKKQVFGGERLPDARCLPDVLPACVRLARLAGTHLLGVGLHHDGEAVSFTGATPVPDLRIGGGALLDGLHRHFTGVPVTVG
ncbi:hypothetical protein ACF06P_38825 [Streptomyces sp. NPDC015684]|uniref:hypothetical protein n=1 Tax=Streptomyces sp. NPDC015684 TaxID=3364963 RepID=UPI0036F62CA3